MAGVIRDVERYMQQHVTKTRLLEVAQKSSRLTEPELDHLEKCGECFGTYAKCILQAAWERVKDKRKKAATSPL
jgi:hypothetical protein